MREFIVRPQSKLIVMEDEEKKTKREEVMTMTEKEEREKRKRKRKLKDWPESDSAGNRRRGS